MVSAWNVPSGTPSGPPGGQQGEQLRLPQGQAAGPGAPLLRQQGLRPADVGLGAHPLESLASALHLMLSGFLVAQAAARLADEKPRPGEVVARVQLPPQPGRAPEQGEGGAGITGGKRDRALGVHRRPLQVGGSEIVRDPPELGARGPGLVELAGCEGDLDPGRQHAGPGQRAWRLRERAGDAGLGRRDPDLAQSQQRQPRLRAVPVGGGPRERLVGLRVPAGQAVQLSLSVVWVTPAQKAARAARRTSPRSSWSWLAQAITPAPSWSGVVRNLAVASASRSSGASGDRSSTCPSSRAASDQHRSANAARASASGSICSPMMKTWMA